MTIDWPNFPSSDISVITVVVGQMMEDFSTMSFYLYTNGQTHKSRQPVHIYDMKNDKSLCASRLAQVSAAPRMFPPLGEI